MSNENLDVVCCDDVNLQNVDGEMTCINCGMVHEKVLLSKERRAYDKYQMDDRQQHETRWRDFGPRTILPKPKKDFKGNTIKGKKITLYNRLSKIQQSLISSKERNLWEAKPRLKKLTQKLNIPETIIQTAWKIYYTVANKNLTVGRSIDGFIAASLYASIRLHELPRLLEEVAEKSPVPRHTIHRSLYIIIQEILPKLKMKYKPITPEQLIFRFGNCLNLPIEIQKKAANILIAAYKGGLKRVGKDPKGFAASVIYMAAKPTKHRKTQNVVSGVARITEVTLRSRIKDIVKLTE